ncbi:MAG TPA: alpha/beta hydrolase [Micromonosporaceae bacterium]
MVTYRQLWAADPAAWRRAGAAWQRAGELVGRRGAEVSDTAAALRSHWSSPAGRAADTVLGRVRVRLHAGRPALVEADQILAEHASRVAQAKAMLDVAVTSAAALGVLVDRDGRTFPDPSAPRPDQAAAAHRIRAEITAALGLAAAADRETTRRLGDLAAAAVADWPVEPPPSRPSPHADPGTVRGWWAGLTEAQRRWLVLHEPALIGRLDGVPVAARDQANRLLLAHHRAALGHHRQPGRGRRADGALAGLHAIEAQLTADAGPRAYLLGLDPAGDGRVIVAIGNPDRADNVLTYVPGMTSDLASAGGELTRVLRVARRCAELGPTEQTAAVLWLDYDAPDFVHEAFRASYAHDAGPALHRFQEGLRATHDGPPAHQTVLGHSYGSLVVGATAREHGLAADSLVFVGSPGVGVDHADELGVAPGQVWSSTARNDIIQYAAPSLDQALERLGLGVTPLLAPLFALRSHDELWFGQNPSHPGFGGRVFHSDPHGHTGYWEPGNAALDGMARIALGGDHQRAVR